MNTKENTITVVISIGEVMRSMYAESIWNEAISETSVPPVHNLSRAEDNDEVLRRVQVSYQRLTEVFSGYITECSSKEGEDEQWRMEMKMRDGITLQMVQKMEEAIVSGALKEVYEPQLQAEELAEYYKKRYDDAVSAIKKYLAK